MAATQKGVDDKEVVIIGNAPRNDLVSEIADKARKERDEEITKNGGEVVDTLSVEAEDPDNPKPDEEVQEIKPEEEKPDEPEVHPEEQKAHDDKAEKYVTIKVDGQEKMVPESLVNEAGIRTLQKEATADQRLAEATRLLREANEQRNAPPAKPLPDMDEIELANRIRMGTDEEAQEAIRILKGRDQATPEQIENAVSHRVLQTIEFNDAGAWFQNEYKEIVADPYLVQLAISEETRLRSSGDTRPFKAVYKDIGDGIRKKLVEWKGGKASVSTSAEKQERKNTITNLPAASSTQQPDKEQPKPKTASEKIEDMRMARGQR